MDWTQALWQSWRTHVRRWVAGFCAWRSSGELQDLYDHAPCAYFTLDERGRFLRLNARALGWLGCTREEALNGLGPADFLTPDSRAQFAECFAVLLAHGPVDGMEFDLVSRLGVRRHVSLSATTDGWSFGPLQQARCVLHDTTELMRAKTRLLALAAEQRAILDNDLVGIIKLNGARTVWKNRTVERMFGYLPGELRSQTLRALYRSDTEYAEIAEAAAAAMERGDRFRTEVQLVRKDGDLLWIDLCAVRVSSATNETVWSFVDVTRMERRQEQANRLKRAGAPPALPRREQVEAVSHAEASHVGAQAALGGL